MAQESTTGSGVDDPIGRAAELAALGLRARLPAGALARLIAATVDPDARVRGAAIGALVRRGTVARASDAWRAAATDADPAVRRRVAELGPPLAARGGVDREAVGAALVARLADDDVTVVEAAAWALGELGSARRAARSLTRCPRSPRSRRSTATRWRVRRRSRRSVRSATSAAAPPILAACSDKPAVRRRAVLALAPFVGPDVDAALERAARRSRLAGAAGRRGSHASPTGEELARCSPHPRSEVRRLRDARSTRLSAGWRGP